MREFTSEEKELIVNTPITMGCFDMQNFNFVRCDNEFGLGVWIDRIWETQIDYCERLRKKYILIKDDSYFIELVRLLPNSYKVVKL